MTRLEPVPLFDRVCVTLAFVAEGLHWLLASIMHSSGVGEQPRGKAEQWLLRDRKSKVSWYLLPCVSLGRPLAAVPRLFADDLLQECRRRS